MMSGPPDVPYEDGEVAPSGDGGVPWEDPEESGADSLFELDQHLEAQFGYQMSMADLEKTVVLLGGKMRRMVDEAGGDFDPLTFAYSFMIGMGTSQELDSEGAEAWINDLERNGFFDRISTSFDDSLES